MINKMGRKKTTIKLHQVVTIKCPNCGGKSKRNSPKDSSPQIFECTKCNRMIRTPLACCCIICAFSNKKCIPALMMEAKMKGLKIKE